MIKNLIFLFGFSTFVTVVWVSSTIYHNSVTSRITPANKIRIEKIAPEFDTEVIDQLEARQEVRVNLDESAAIIDGESIKDGTPSARTVSPTPQPTSVIELPVITEAP